MAKILNIEDEEQLLPVMKGVLAEHLGHELTFAETLKEGREKYDSDTFDLAITDRELPDGKGFDFIRYVREKGDKMPVIMYSGGATPEHEKMAYEAGADDFIYKPFDISELITKVKKFLG